METSSSIKTMALSTSFTATRSTFAGAVADRAGKTPQTRGLVLNGQPCEVKLIVKLTGDTTGNVDVSSVFTGAIRQVMVMPTRDSAGANVAAAAWTDVAFTKTDYNTIALTGLGDWTVALMFIFGRAE